MEILYDLYVHIRKSGLDRTKQSNLIRQLTAGEEWSWRVEGISIAALKRFKENKFEDSKGICRDHSPPFHETVKPMQTSSAALSN